MIKVAINGYGRIGRVTHRIIIQKHADEVEVVAINAGKSTDLKGWMYLLKYDSTYGVLDAEVSVKPNTDAAKKDLLGYLTVNGKDIPVYSQKDPTLLPWKEHNVDVVIESTGVFVKYEQLEQHIKAGAKAAVLSAPTKSSEAGVIPTYVLSINDKDYKGEKMISNASCTTNCIMPVVKVLDQTFGVEKAMMSTIHAYTSDQNLLDGGHKDYRRARAAGVNIVPTTTGAAKAAGKAYSPLSGIFDGLSFRVPVQTGSLSDITMVLKKNTTKEEINETLKKAAATAEYKGIMQVTEEPLVSGDIIGNPHSSIVDLPLTMVVGGNLVKVVVWYDNEFGYANRLVEQTIHVGASLK